MQFFSPFKDLDVDESADAMKAAPCTIDWLYCFNQTNSVLYVKIYNALLSNVVVGTSVPLLTIPVPGNNDLDGGGVMLRNVAYLDTGFVIACTTGLADNDTGAPSLNAMVVNGAII